MYSLLSLCVLVQSTADEGLTFDEILSDIPTDPASVFTILLLVGSVGAVLWFGNRSNGKGDT